ncbi:hypothetical protein BGZ58_000966, partial [Dissophora ornata]
MRKASVENQLSFAKTQAKLSTSAMNIIGHILTPQLKGPYDPSIPTLVPEGEQVEGGGCRETHDVGSSARAVVPVARSRRGSMANADDDLDLVTKRSPFSELIARLYKLHGHNPPELEKCTIAFSCPISQDLYDHADAILNAWRSASKLEQKDCVALLGIVNTIDEANSRFYKDFESIQEDYVIPDFYNITKSHRMVIDELKSQFGSGRTQ